MRVFSKVFTAALAALACGSASAQVVDSLITQNPITRTDTVQTVRPAPMGPDGLAWLARDVVPGAGWQVVYRDHRGAVLAKPVGEVNAGGELMARLRLEYRQPIEMDGRSLRSVDVDV